ncbi:GTPase-activator protein [Serratia phage 2050H1]|uniref:GTPase-activator protein n=2 Tax=Miltonvirus MAM1 TaxID=2169689 RepID=A0A249Y2M0_9CAUD|nr:GTPase-activator protein [Serratia phage 2050H1]
MVVIMKKLIIPSLGMKPVDAVAGKQRLIHLDREDTAKFYDGRSAWGSDVKVQQTSGEMIKLPWRTLPTRLHTRERYFVGAVEVIPAFDFHGLANAYRKYRNHNNVS